MNAGKDYHKAKAQAQANANRTHTPRYLSMYAGQWWIDYTPGTNERERINPEVPLWRDEVAQGSVRERLALLAVVGPGILTGWTYNPSTDTWTHADGQRIRVGAVGEGSASLARILADWQIDRRQAMQLIGFPEKD